MKNHDATNNHDYSMPRACDYDYDNEWLVTTGDDPADA